MIDLIGRLTGMIATLAGVDAVTTLLPDAGALTSISDETEKIDAAVTDGLAGVSNSLAYRVHEIEKHLHSKGCMYGKDPGDTFLLEDGLVSWRVTAGAIGVYGAWVQLSNGDEIADPKWDRHKLMITAASANGSLYYIQLGTGEAAAQVAESTEPFLPSAQLRQGSVSTQIGRIDNTDKLWGRCKCEVGAATIDFVLGGHSYPG